MASEKRIGDDDPLKINSFEDLLELAGTNGWRNYLIFILASVTSMVPALTVFSYQFLGVTPEHWCHVEELVNHNWTAVQIKEIAIPKGESCEMYDLNYADIGLRSYEEVKKMVETNEIRRLNKTQCQSRDFEDHVETIVNKWDLVCERRALYSTTQAAVQGGSLVGSFMVGFFVDRFGRRFMYRVCVFLGIFVLFLTSVSPNIYAFIAFRLLSAVMGFGFYMSNFVLCMELSSKKQRALVGCYIVIPWAFGMILTAGIAYFVRPWRQLQIALSIPCLALLFNCWILPESPRWLILKGRFEEAIAILKSIAKSNKKVLPTDEDLTKRMNSIYEMNADSNPSKEQSISKRILDAFKQMFSVLLDRELRGQTFLLFFCWFAVAMVYYGVSLGSSTLSTDVYLYITLSGLIELPCYLVMWPVVAFLGRRKSLCLFYLACALSIFSVMALVLTDDKGFQSLRLVLFLGGKFGITAAFQLIWMYTAELYPTQLRSLLVGQSSAVARIGSMCSPYINDLLGEKIHWGPPALFGGISLVAGLAALTFRETSGENLPDSAPTLLSKSSIKSVSLASAVEQKPS